MDRVQSSQIDDEICSDIIEYNTMDLIRTDDVNGFVSYIKSQLGEENEVKNGSSKLCPSKLLRWICRRYAVNCATALVRGETGMTLDLNVPLQDGLFPLHHAALASSSQLTDLFIQNGAQADVRCNDVGQFSGWLPLNVAVESLCQHITWTPKQSIFKLVVTLWGRNLQQQLETVQLIANETTEFREVGFHYAKEGKLVEFAALLAAAWDKIILHRFDHETGCNPDGSVKLRRIIAFEIASLIDEEENKLMGPECRKLSLICKEKKRLMKAMMLLLEIFRRGGSLMESFWLVWGYETSGEDSLARQIAGVLRCLSLPMTNEDATYLEALDWFSLHSAPLPLVKRLDDPVKHGKFGSGQLDMYTPSNLQCLFNGKMVTVAQGKECREL